MFWRTFEVEVSRSEYLMSKPRKRDTWPSVSTGRSLNSVETTCTWLSRSDSPWLLVIQVLASSCGTWALRRMRLASIILATVRPDAADEPKVEGICQLAVAKVSLVKAFGVLPSPRSAVAKAAAMMRSSHSRATPAAAAETSCEVG